jgi:hypothetical protein
MCREATWESETLVPDVMGHGTEGAAGDDVDCASRPMARACLGNGGGNTPLPSTAIQHHVGPDSFHARAVV